MKGTKPLELSFQSSEEIYDGHALLMSGVEVLKTQNMLTLEVSDFVTSLTSCWPKQVTGQAHSQKAIKYISPITKPSMLHGHIQH